jgi:hypothetical protein
MAYMNTALPNEPTAKEYVEKYAGIDAAVWLRTERDISDIPIEKISPRSKYKTLMEKLDYADAGRKFTREEMNER